MACDRDLVSDDGSDDEVDVQRLLLVGADVDVEVGAVSLGISLLVATDDGFVFRIDESEEVAEVDAGKADQFCEGTVERVVGAEEVDVGGASAGWNASEDSGAPLEEPVRFVALGEDAAEKSAEVLLANPILG